MREKYHHPGADAPLLLDKEGSRITSHAFENYAACMTRLGR